MKRGRSEREITKRNGVKYNNMTTFRQAKLSKFNIQILKNWFIEIFYCLVPLFLCGNEVSPHSINIFNLRGL